MSKVNFGNTAQFQVGCCVRLACCRRPSSLSWKHRLQWNTPWRARFGGRARLGRGSQRSSTTELPDHARVPTLHKRAGGGGVGGSARSLHLAAAAETKGSRGSWRTTSALLTWFFFPSQGRKSGRNEVGTLLFFCLFCCFFLHITLVPNNCRANYLQQQSLRGGKGLQLSPLATTAIRTHLFKMNESVGP